MAYQFKNPGKIRTRQRTADQPNYIDISGEEWHWMDGGLNFSIKWDKLQLLSSIKEFLKAFLAYRLSKQSLWATYTHDVKLIRIISKSTIANAFPWSKLDILSFLGTFTQENEADNISGFKTLYRWCTQQNIEGFSREILLIVTDYRIKRRKTYEKVFLSQAYLTSEQEYLLLEEIDRGFKNRMLGLPGYWALRDNIILQLGFELAPRPIQFHTLDISDFTATQSPTGEMYYSLNLPMAKKRANDKIEKRHRNISKQLGEKISLLLKITASEFPTETSPLFKLGPDYDDRMSSALLSYTIALQLQEIGFPKGSGATLLRHHLAQSLADQGASAETIAEIMGHNSTIPARAYIAATPKIAAIKTRALGKNKTYENIMQMLLTGEITDRNGVPGERYVKGLVGSQYIGGIGACGLPENTACPKNPVYSCYTCHKFHPFQDGTHEEVKIQLQKQVQVFIDVAEKSLQMGNNRTVLQLEKTIEAVDSVIQRITELKSPQT